MPRDLVLQAEVLGVQVAFTVDAPTDPGEINGVMDRYADAIRRMRAREELRYQYIDLLSVIKALRDLPQSTAAYRQKRPAERMALEMETAGERDAYKRHRLDGRIRERASWSAAWTAMHPNHRGEFEETQQHRNALIQFDAETEGGLSRLAADAEAKLAKFDAETEEKLKEYADAVVAMPAQIAALRAIIARLERRVAGESELDAMLDDLRELDRAPAIAAE